MNLIIEPLLGPNEKFPVSKNDVLTYCGQILGMCYEQGNFDKIKMEPVEKSIRRATMCIKSGHHSGFEHVKITFEILHISKLFTMILNNQSVYATSEKSGRYTVLNFEDPVEEALRKKWQERFCDILSSEYYEMFERFYTKPNVEPEKNKRAIETAIVKKAQENSRLITSPFAKTKLIYTINIRQLSYLRFELKEFISQAPNTSFYKRLKDEMESFLELTQAWGMEEEGLNPCGKNITLPFFETAAERKEEFGENYCINYYLSFATFAQIQRHRTCHYTVTIPEEKQYFIPPFIEDKEELVKEWLDDCKSVTTEESFPQATMILINERGRYEDFILKCYERLCGATQYEAATVTKQQLEKYIKNVTSDNAREALEKINTGARCTFGFRCASPCMFGAKYAFERKF